MPGDGIKTLYQPKIAIVRGGLLTFIDAANSAQTVAALIDHYGQAVGAYGYDRFLYAMMSFDPLHQWHTIPGIASKYPEDWMSFYAQNNLMAIDPVRQVGGHARRAFRWDEIPTLIRLTNKQEKCLQQGTEAGLFNGIGVPFHGPHGEAAGVGLATSERNVEVTPTAISMLSLISAQFHTAYVDLSLGPIARPMVQLTNREREVLTWCFAGKSRWEIARILDISEETVKFHVKNCVRKLDADSKVTAVLKALRLGLINP